MAEKSFIHDKKNLKWFANLWYHYKTAILLGTFALIIVICTVSSVLKTVDYDLEIAWLTVENKSESVCDNLAEELKDTAEDADGKGGVTVFCHNYFYDVNTDVKTEVEIASATEIQLELTGGDSYLFIMDEFWLKSAKTYQVLDDISALTGNDDDIYAVDITDTKLIKSSGYSGDKRIYAGVRKLDPKRAKKEIYNIKHKNAENALKYILNNK